MSNIIVDATVWLNFARVDRVAKLVEALPQELAVGLQVEKEVRVWPKQSALAGQAFSLDEYVDRGLLERAEMTAAEMAIFHATKVRLRLGDGETEALVIAANRGWAVATDDGPARKRIAADNASVRLSGTIGLLRALVKATAVTQRDATELLTVMRERGARLPDEKI